MEQGIGPRSGGPRPVPVLGGSGRGFMIFRLGSRSKPFESHIFTPLLSFICRKRAGIVWKVVQAR
jgi:hypothetical protein